MIEIPAPAKVNGDKLTEELEAAGFTDVSVVFYDGEGERPNKFGITAKDPQGNDLRPFPDDNNARMIVPDQGQLLAESIVMAHKGDLTQKHKDELAKAQRLDELKAKNSFSKAETDELLKLLLERL